MRKKQVCIISLSWLVIQSALAENYDSACVEQALQMSSILTVTALKEHCQYKENIVPQKISNRVKRRLFYEGKNSKNPFALTPHRPNYYLPYVYNSSPNREAFASAYGDSLSKVEFQFQLSLKILLFEELWGGRGQLYLAYTNHSFWQAYNSDISSPFRESNHEPELMLVLKSHWTLWGFENVGNIITFNHQSNGQSGDLSRSWNRIMLQSVWSKGNLAIYFRPWYRIPENADEYPGDPSGDDNPDIDDFMGRFDLQTAYSYGKNQLGFMLRNNVKSDNKGAVELTWSYKVKPKVNAFIRYFDGYGESLIDYNQRMQTLGFGMELSGWF